MTEANKSGHPALSGAIADKLLDKLSNDDGFRDMFSSDPAGALRTVGQTDSLARASLDGQSCLMVNNLASKEEIQKSRDQLRDYLTSSGTHTVVFCFEAGEVASRLK